jgi:hypothetical protein
LNPKIQLKPCGFFKEFAYGEGESQSVKDAVCDEPQANEQLIIAYLKNGHLFVISPCVNQDVIACDGRLASPSGIQTDGVWMWPLELAYYVEKYHLELPSEFIVHLQANKWEVPFISQTTLAQLCERNFPD